MSELEGHSLGDVAQQVARVKPDAQEETIAAGLSGKALKRVEIENQVEQLTLRFCHSCKVAIESVQLCCSTMLLNYVGANVN
jgi:hypothetical protein